MSSDLDSFYDHFTSHTGEYRHKCDLCGFMCFSLQSADWHHRDYHSNKKMKFSTSKMILEDGWPYIHVCKSCMLISISVDQCVNHLENSHNGKSDYQKINMSRAIVVHGVHLDKKRDEIKLIEQEKLQEEDIANTINESEELTNDQLNSTTPTKPKKNIAKDFRKQNSDTSYVSDSENLPLEVDENTTIIPNQSFDKDSQGLTNKSNITITNKSLPGMKELTIQDVSGNKSSSNSQNLTVDESTIDSENRHINKSNEDFDESGNKPMPDVFNSSIDKPTGNNLSIDKSVIDAEMSIEVSQMSIDSNKSLTGANNMDLDESKIDSDNESSKESLTDILDLPEDKSLRDSHDQSPNKSLSETQDNTRMNSFTGSADESTIDDLSMKDALTDDNQLNPVNNLSLTSEQSSEKEISRNDENVSMEKNKQLQMESKSPDDLPLTTESSKISNNIVSNISQKTLNVFLGQDEQEEETESLVPNYNKKEEEKASNMANRISENLFRPSIRSFQQIKKNMSLLDNLFKKLGDGKETEFDDPKDTTTTNNSLLSPQNTPKFNTQSLPNQENAENMINQIEKEMPSNNIGDENDNKKDDENVHSEIENSPQTTIPASLQSKNDAILDFSDNKSHEGQNVVTDDSSKKHQAQSDNFGISNLTGSNSKLADTILKLKESFKQSSISTILPNEVDDESTQEARQTDSDSDQSISQCEDNSDFNSIKNPLRSPITFTKPLLRIKPANELFEMTSTEKQSKLWNCSNLDCNFSTPVKSILIDHVSVMHGIFRCPLPECCASYIYYPQYDKHMKQMHSEERSTICPFIPVCHYKCYNVPQLLTHLKQHHHITPPRTIFMSPPVLQSDLASTDVAEEKDESFIKIESCVTLDPTSASELFGNEAEQENIVEVNKTSPPVIKIAVSTTGGNFSATSQPSPNQNTLILPTNRGPMKVRITRPITTNAVNIVPSTSNILAMPSTSNIQAVSPISKISTISSTSNIQAVSSTSNIPFIKNEPDVVLVDEEKTSPLTPGLIDLNFNPPTVPIWKLFTQFKNHQTFRTYISNLAVKVFKCMERHCIYATDAPEVFNQHLLNHKQSSCYRCCYCLVSFMAPKELTEHVLNEHSHCNLQCKYCLYRSCSTVYIGVHLKNFHPGQESRYIKVGTIRDGPPPSPNIEQFVHPYKCTYGDCGFRTVDAEVFISHGLKHGSNAGFSCVFCSNFYNINDLVVHMRDHQMSEHQCPYCLYGQLKREKLLNHLLNCHPGRKGKVLLRKQFSHFEHASANSESPKPSIAKPSNSVQNLNPSNVSIASSSDLINPPNVSIASSSDLINPINKEVSNTVTHLTPIRSQVVGTPSRNKSPPQLHLGGVVGSPFNLNTSVTPIPNSTSSAGAPSTISENNASNVPVTEFNFSSFPNTIFSGNTNTSAELNQSKNEFVVPTIIPSGGSMGNVASQSVLPTIPSSIIKSSSTSKTSILLPIAMTKSDAIQFINARNIESHLSSPLQPRLIPVTSTTPYVPAAASLPQVKVNIICTSSFSPTSAASPVVSSNVMSSPTHSHATRRSQRKASISSDGDSSMDFTSLDHLSDHDQSDKKPLDDHKGKFGLIGHDLYKCGYENCDCSCESEMLLREHLQVCDFSRVSPVFRCFHCGMKCKFIGRLLDHIKVHGIKRFSCGIEGCTYKATMKHYFKNHMKQAHKCNIFKSFLKNPSNKDEEKQEFVIYPKDFSLTAKEHHRKTKCEYSIDDTDKLPPGHVFNHDIKCYHCIFKTKIKSNLLKHLALHRKYPDGIPQPHKIDNEINPIPASQPINPVPRLSRPELMFDKTINLAGSSFQDKKKIEENNLRKKHPIPQEEFDNLPLEIDTSVINKCCLCHYVSCDEDMLKKHIKTIHYDQNNFTCAHCPSIISVDTLSNHLKLHADKLYRCGWCSYLGTKLSAVERHCRTKHPDETTFTFTIRGTETDDDNKAKEAVVKPIVPEETKKPEWNCGICKFQSVTIHEMTNHTSLKHNTKSQFKCGYCECSSSDRTKVDNHFATKHADKDFKILCNYYRIDSDEIEPIIPGGGKNSHDPLWKRNDPNRILHIRGILLDDDKSSNVASKRGRFISDISIFDLTPCKPDGDEYVCPKCTTFKTTDIKTFKQHLCKEANYPRYECTNCGHKNSLLSNLRSHFTRKHTTTFSSDSYNDLPIDPDLECWVESIISFQEKEIINWKKSGAPKLNLIEEGQAQKSFIKGKYTCDICNTVCRSASGLSRHHTSVHLAKFKCKHCPYSCNNEMAVQQHMLKKHPKLLKSSLHPSVSDINHEPIEEINASENNEIVQEDISSDITPSQENSNSEKINKKILKCPFCPHTTISKTGLTNHQHWKHKDKMRYKCQYCNSKYTNTDDITHHHNQKHSYHPISFIDLNDDKPTANEEILVNKEKQIEEIAEKIEEEGQGEVISRFKCCYCSHESQGTQMEEHMKAKHKDLPYMLKHEMTKEGIKTVSVEQYHFKCAHCTVGSSSLMTAMDHWFKLHVTLDFKFEILLEKTTIVSTEEVPTEPKKITNNDNTDDGTVDSSITEPVTPESPIKSKEPTPMNTSTELSEENYESDVDSISVINDDVPDILSPTKKMPIRQMTRKRKSVSVSNEEHKKVKIDSYIELSHDEESDTLSSPSKSPQKQNQSNNQKLKKNTILAKPLNLSESEDEFDLPDVNVVPKVVSEVVYKCGYCRKSSNNKTDIEVHHTQFHKTKPSKVFEFNKEDYTDQYQMKHFCEHCGKKGSMPDLIKHHNATHIGVQIDISRIKPESISTHFKCLICQRLTKSKAAIKQHMIKNHPQESPDDFTRIFANINSSMKCNYCGDILPTIEDVKFHIEFVHNNLPVIYTDLSKKASKPKTLTVETNLPTSSNVSLKNSDHIGQKYIKNTARKSISPGAYKRRSIAIKSTGSKRRRLDELIDSSCSIYSENTEEFSYYNVPQEKLDLDEIYYEATFNEKSVRINVKQMNTFTKLYPTVLLNDIVKCKALP